MIEKAKKAWQMLFVFAFPRHNKYEFQIETTNICNAKCDFCPNSSLKRKKQVMNLEVFEKILERIRNEKIKVKRFILHLNGEPLSDPYLFKRIDMLHKCFAGVPIRFTTNFSLANPETRKKIFMSEIDEITISINSLDPEEYRRIMGLPFEKTMENVRAFLAEKERCNSSIRVNFSIVAGPDNQEMVKQFTEEFKDKGNVRIIRLGKWVSDLNKNTETKTKARRICHSLYDTIAFLSNGELALCCFDAEGIINQNVMNCPILKTWKRGRFQKIRRTHLIHGITNKECKNCSFS